ncbi:ATP-binding protein [Streptomyces spiramyceticus]|uniref:ATP-binding protein n=1 Tax=Streptomyces spiramyceticus TaxID=299717 RepID=UPI00237C4536|nr:ATP-binding protein [Streptomyces spiramyceticus]
MSRQARILVPGDPSAIAFARDHVLTHVRAWGVSLDEELRDAVKLVASELITNAVVHGGGFATVGLYLNDGRLLLVVHDGNPAEPQRQYATGDDEAGRGLALVNFLAARSGWEPTARGKKMWAEFEVPVPPPSARGEVLRRRMKAAVPRAYVNTMPLAMSAGL